MKDTVLTATQTVGGAEGDPSDPVTVLDGIPIEDFAVTPVEGACAAGTTTSGKWVECVSTAYAEIRTGTLAGSSAMWIYDGGWGNGVYKIYEAVVPADGRYHLSCLRHIDEDPDQVNSIKQYQMGVIVNGPVDRCNAPARVVDLALPGNAVGWYQGLTSGNNTSLPVQTVRTGGFDAHAGDSLMIMFSTNLLTKMIVNGVTYPYGTFNETDPLNYNPTVTSTTWEMPRCWSTTSSCARAIRPSAI